VTASNKAVFLDKDGTLIPDVPYCINPDQAIVSLNTTKALRVLAELGYQLFIITNQSGVARGYFDEKQVDLLGCRFSELFESIGVQLQGFYYCPHHPEGEIAPYNIDCECRKPKPGMIFKAAQEHSIDLKSSWFIGDILNDVEAGRRAGCRTILLDNGNETEWRLSRDRFPHHIVENLENAALVVFSELLLEKNRKEIHENSSITATK
jgi:D,D-heptose 1,7-bisphosphate phosphatase